MRCEECGDCLIDYYYGEDEPERRQEVAAHLASCSACAMEYCRLDADLSGIGTMLEDAPRPEVQRRLRQDVERAFAPPWWRRLLRLGTFPIPAYQAMLVLCLVLLAWTFLRAPASKPPTAVPVAPGSTTLLFKDYDASTLVSVDPNLL
jgi:anti-sigma factor RsiW